MSSGAARRSDAPLQLLVSLPCPTLPTSGQLETSARQSSPDPGTADTTGPAGRHSHRVVRGSRRTGSYLGITWRGWRMFALVLACEAAIILGVYFLWQWVAS